MFLKFEVSKLEMRLIVTFKVAHSNTWETTDSKNYHLINNFALVVSSMKLNVIFFLNTFNYN